MFPLKRISILITGQRLFPSIRDKGRRHGGGRRREIIGTLRVKSQRLKREDERGKKDREEEWEGWGGGSADSGIW